MKLVREQLRLGFSQSVRPSSKASENTAQRLNGAGEESEDEKKSSSWAKHPAGLERYVIGKKVMMKTSDPNS